MASSGLGWCWNVTVVDVLSAWGCLSIHVCHGLATVLRSSGHPLCFGTAGTSRDGQGQLVHQCVMLSFLWPAALVPGSPSTKLSALVDFFFLLFCKEDSRCDRAGAGSSHASFLGQEIRAK